MPSAMLAIIATIRRCVNVIPPLVVVVVVPLVVVVVS